MQGDEMMMHIKQGEYIGTKEFCNYRNSRGSAEKCYHLSDNGDVGRVLRGDFETTHRARIILGHSFLVNCGMNQVS